MMNTDVHASWDSHACRRPQYSRHLRHSLLVSPSLEPLSMLHTVSVRRALCARRTGFVTSRRPASTRAIPGDRITLQARDSCFLMMTFFFWIMIRKFENLKNRYKHAANIKTILTFTKATSSTSQMDIFICNSRHIQ